MEETFGVYNWNEMSNHVLVNIVGKRKTNALYSFVFVTCCSENYL